MSGTPTGAAFDIVLVLHVGFMLVAFASLMATGVQAWRARRGPESPSALSVGRYFRPGINFPGRAVYLVLVLGIALVAMSRGAYDFGDAFVQLGLILWIVAVAVAEMVVWPGERVLQRIVSGTVDASGGPDDSEPPSQPGADSYAGVHIADPRRADPRHADSHLAETETLWLNTALATSTATRVALSAWAVCAVLVLATVLMVQKP